MNLVSRAMPVFCFKPSPYSVRSSSSSSSSSSTCKAQEVNVGCGPATIEELAEVVGRLVVATNCTDKRVWGGVRQQGVRDVFEHVCVSRW